jgi:hypothetical protein
MGHGLAKRRGMAIIKECILALLVVALGWRVGLPMGTMPSMDGQGQMIEVCTLTGLEILPNAPDQSTKLMDQCPLAMAGVIGAPPPMSAVMPPKTVGAVQTIQFTKTVRDNAPFRASPPRGPPAVHA